MSVFIAYHFLKNLVIRFSIRVRLRVYGVRVGLYFFHLMVFRIRRIAFPELSYYSSLRLFQTVQDSLYFIYVSFSLYQSILMDKPV